MTETIEKVWIRLKRKGGKIHASAKHGMIAYINDEKPTVLVKPIPKDKKGE